MSYVTIDALDEFIPQQVLVELSNDDPAAVGVSVPVLSGLIQSADEFEAAALTYAQRLCAGPTFAHGITKTQINQEWSMSLEQAIEAAPPVGGPSAGTIQPGPGPTR